MSPTTFMSVAGLVLTLQVLTLGYAVSIEKRLTRLETIQEIRGGIPHPRPAAPVRA